MTDITDQTRAELLERFAAFAAGALGGYPGVRSIMLSVSQYMEYDAPEVDLWISLSIRDQPVWPHGVDGARRLAEAPGRWAIERLHCRYEMDRPDALIDALARANLPRLRELVLSLEGPPSFSTRTIDRLTDAAWWATPGRLLPHLHPGKQLAIAEYGETCRPAGWQAMFDDRRPGRVELSMIGWHARATIDQLRGLLDALPDRELVLVSSRYRQWLPDDLALLPDRNVRLEATP